MEDERTLDDLILESARLNVALRKRFKSAKHDPTARYYTYVLLLQNENVYVGSTNSLFIRFMEHFHVTDMSSCWVREHGPPVRVLEVSKNSREDDERYKALEYMQLFGHESVRGASWCKVELKSPPAALQTFVRDRADFQYVARSEIDEALEIAAGLAEQLR